MKNEKMIPNVIMKCSKGSLSILIVHRVEFKSGIKQRKYRGVTFQEVIRILSLLISMKRTVNYIKQINFRNYVVDVLGIKSLELG